MVGHPVRGWPARATTRADHRDRTGGRAMKDYAASWEALKQTDAKVAEAIPNERDRGGHTLRLIAAENYTSPAVLAALASTMNNKYAEGYPGRRYYGGGGFVGATEQLATDRAEEAFVAGHANLQPPPGAPPDPPGVGGVLEAQTGDKGV